jgi:coproporphyrinogen III oxidase
VRERAVGYFRELQDRITNTLEALDGTAKFREDAWTRAGGGGGRTRVIEGGALFEKGGVNVSEVHGELPAELAATMPGSGRTFYAAGISLVLHPLSPMIPTVHANFRYLEKGDAAWFGGGSDLTPYYLFAPDVQHFHRTWKGACDRLAPDAYARFKAECDRYFFLPHRGETRGVGGIFFDYEQGDTERLFDFVRGCGDAFLPAYLPIAERRRSEPWGEREQAWQHLRRGRYAEFNLLYDRGTVFGLKTGGRVESILMSLPPRARWGYGESAQPGSREAELVDALKPRAWI